ncbi:hypothetical protein MBLNU459_g5745t1 [Dothideomycetes sp. NU459]
MPSAATSRVFAIPELLELILLSIPEAPASEPFPEDPRSPLVHQRSTSLHSLLTAQRVSRAFARTIRSSSAIQRALYLQPSRTTASWTADQGVGRPSLNPMVQVPFQWRFSHLPPDGSGRYSAYMVFERADMEYWRRRPGSWQVMLLSQPPSTDVAAVVWDREDETLAATRPAQGPVVYAFERVKDEAGIRLGHLHQTVADMFDRDPLVRQIKICSV